MIRKLGTVLAEELAGRRALDWTAGIARYHREPGMPGHRQALDYILAEVEPLGLDEVEAREYVYDGKRVYYSTWASVAHWTPRVGRLELVQPESRLLADFSEIPVTLGIRSAPTPSGGLTTELVDVGPGTLPAHYAGKDVRGKIVLCDPNGQLGIVAMDMARLHGARGVVACNLIDQPPVVSREDRPDHIAHVWTTYWWLGTPHDFTNDIFSFSISPRQLAYLRALLARGPVTVRAVVDAEFSGGTIRQISGLIRGRELPDEEVVYLGHVDHPWPGANDNASGCGVMIELAGTLARLIRSGALPRPRRSIRFLWDVHLIGGVMWAEDHPGWGSRVVAGFAPDGVGIGVGPGGALRFTRTSDTRPSYLNDLVTLLGQELPVHGLRSQRMRLEPGPAAWHFREAPWSGGNDAGPINDRSIGAHAIGLGHGSDSNYHTDRDTYVRLDVQEYERSAWLQGTAGFLVADSDEGFARLLGRVIASSSAGRLARVEQSALMTLEKAETRDERARATLDGIDRIGYAGKQTAAALRSTHALGAGTALTSTVSELERDVTRAAEQMQARLRQWAHDRFGEAGLKPLDPTEAEARARTVMPVRRFEGPFNYHDVRRILATRIGWERTHWLAELQMSLPYPTLSYSGIPGVFLAIDGETTLLDIARRVRHEYGIAPDLTALLRLLDDLAEAGFVELT